MKLSVVLPVYNQSGHVGSIVDAYVDSLSQLRIDFELILVPNGCRDDSAAVCLRLSEVDHRIRTVCVTSSGWGGAVIAGLQAASGDILCYTNSARTRAELLADVVERALTGERRVVKVTRIERTGLRWFGSTLYNLLGRSLLGLRGWDMNGTPKVFPRDFKGLLSLSESSDLLDLEFMVICQRSGYPVDEVMASWGDRVGGVSTTTLTSAVFMYVGVFRVWFRGIFGRFILRRWLV